MEDVARRAIAAGIPPCREAVAAEPQTENPVAEGGIASGTDCPASGMMT
jgi:hypothetical protein